MKQSFSAPITALLAALMLLSVPRITSAQMDFSLDDAEEPVEDDSGGSMDFGVDDAEGGDGDVFGQLASGDDTLGADTDGRERRTESAEEIFAVQQIYALRLNRVELAPSASFTINDPYASHPAIALALNYWFTNVLAVGVSGQWFQFGDPQRRESDLNFFVRRSTRLGIPVNEWQVGAYLNFTYVPFYGKFAVFNEFIFQWDAYIVGGVGLMRTRPIPVIDPEIREFDFQNRVAFNLGIGFRVFLSRFAGIFVEFRDYAFLEKFENLEVSVGPARRDRDTWFSPNTTFSNNVTVQVGFTLFFPFTFEYRLPK
ncbi:MAG: outer membrane beta-barrel domain-containing protein [Myxococcales bacterium]|nr:outer membrane beta-barrel domain-containing protein [Myxococcales bacterium]